MHLLASLSFGCNTVVIFLPSSVAKWGEFSPSVLEGLLREGLFLPLEGLWIRTVPGMKERRRYSLAVPLAQGLQVLTGLLSELPVKSGTEMAYRRCGSVKFMGSFS
jgi:hypothetical protein